MEGGIGAEPLTYGFVDAEVMIGCVPPAQPSGISATQNRSDGVLVGWSGVPSEGAEYRVYRNTVNNPATALSLGATWVSGTSFLDISAQVPVAGLAEGCANVGPAVEVHYFYWVRARSAAGCQGELSSSSAEGSGRRRKSRQRDYFPALDGEPLRCSYTAGFWH